MGAMSACIGGMNSHSSKEVKFNLMNSPNYSLGEKRKKFREQQKNNSQVFVPIKNDEEELIKNKEDLNIYQNHNIINQFHNNKNKDNININTDNKAKVKGKINVCIKKKIIRNLEDYCDIIECEDEFECNKNIANSFKNTELLSGKRINYLPIQKISLNNLEYFKNNNIKKENGKENENENDKNNELNNCILNDSFNNKEINMELSASKRMTSINNDNKKNTIFDNLQNNEENGGKTLENENINNDYKNNGNKKNINDSYEVNTKEKEDNIIKDNNINLKINENKNNNSKFNNNLVINDYYEGGITNLKYNKLYKITKPNNLSFNKKNLDNNLLNNDIKNNNNKIKSIDIIKKSSSVKNSNKKNIDFNDCQIDNNINFNISNNNILTNNNQNNNLNNINNNFNNISSINSDFNNNNYIDVSSNMTYFLSLEKSQRKATSSRFDKNILSLKKHNINSNASYSKEISSNNDRNSVRVNKYKWKLLPNHKYNTQIYKSLINIPLSRESQSLLMNESGQKNLNLTPMNNNKNQKNSNNNHVISEIKKQKDDQDKAIKSLENKIKNLENIEEKNNEKIIKLEEYINNKNKIKHNNNKNYYKASNKNSNKNSINNSKRIEKKVKNSLISEINLAESQKDFRIKKLEEQLNNVKKDNKLNKTLLKKKNEQIKNLLEKKNKQDVIIKQYEIAKTTKNKNYNTKGNKKINLLDDYTTNNNNHDNIITSNPNNITESKISITERINTKNNLNNSINANFNKKDEKRESFINQKLRISQKKDNSLTIQKQFFNHNNSSNLTEYFGFDQENNNINNYKIRSSMRESSKLKLNHNTKTKNTHNKTKNNNNHHHNRSSVNISYNNYCNDLCNKAKKNYSNKITLNKMKIYKLNKSQNLTLFNEHHKTNRLLDISKNSIKNGIKEEFNMDLNILNPNTTKSMKKFSFTKSKKLLKKNSEKSLTEMYLQAGTVQNEDNSINNYNMNSSNNNGDLKLLTYNDLFLLTQKNSFSCSNNNTTVTNKNNNINMSLSPMFSPSNISQANLDNLSLDDKLNISENNNNINMFNPYFKSISNEKFEKESNKIYQNLWQEGYLRYKHLKDNTNEENTNIIINEEINKLILNFCMASELIYLNVDKDDLMLDIKNKFLDIFLKQKKYGDNEKKYIRDNILFLNKGEIIDINKKIKENNLNNGDVIVPVLKDVT